MNRLISVHVYQSMETMNATTKIVVAVLARFPRRWLSNAAPVNATHAAALLAKRGIELVGAPESERAGLWAVFLLTRGALAPAPVGSLAEALLLAASNATDAASGEISVAHADERSEEALLAALVLAAVAA